LAFPDIFPEGYGSQKNMMDKYGISKESLVSEILQLIK
jgi:hypothetical protein